jgi:hypothetical protein
MKHDKDASEATLAVLEQQIKSREPIEADEAAATILVNTEQPLELDKLVQQIKNKTAVN